MGSDSNGAKRLPVTPVNCGRLHRPVIALAGALMARMAAGMNLGMAALRHAAAALGLPFRSCRAAAQPDAVRRLLSGGANDPRSAPGASCLNVLFCAPGSGRPTGSSHLPSTRLATSSDISPWQPAFPCGKSAIAIVRDRETHEKSRSVSTPPGVNKFRLHSPSSFTYSYSTTDLSFTYGADAELNSAKCRDFRCTSKAARFL